MSYPSIISQPGSASRNVQPIIDALSPYIQDPNDRSPPTGEGSRKRRRILEVGSGGCTHIQHFADKWKDIDWIPTVRNHDEMEMFSRECEYLKTGKDNLRPGMVLDIASEDDWLCIQQASQQISSEGGYDGVILINIIHCLPPNYPERLFDYLVKYSILLAHGFVATYSPFLSDDGSYKSDGDRTFDTEYIKSKSANLGLRTIKSLSMSAEKYGFIEIERKEMPKGNMWVVYQAKG